MASDPAKRPTSRPTPKPTITLKKVEAVPAEEVGGASVSPVPAGVGSVASPVKATDSVRQPAGEMIAQQKANIPAAKATPPATRPAAPAVKTAIPTTQTPASTPSRKFDLPAAVYSPQLLESVIYDIQYYLDWYRQNQIRKQVGAKPKDEPNHSDETVLVIEAWLNGQPATLESLEELLGALHNLKLDQVHIMLAALPNRSQREALVTWFRTNVGPHLLLSFVADRNLGGGVVVRTPNRVFDYTWKQQLIAGRDKLAEILKRV